MSTIKCLPKHSNSQWVDSSASFDMAQLQLDFQPLFRAPEDTTAPLGKLTDLGDFEQLINGTLRFIPGIDKTKDNCFFLSLREDTPKDLMNRLSILLKAVRGDLKTLLESVLFNGQYVCFPSNEVPLTILEKIPWIQIVERDQVYKKSLLENTKEEFIYSTSQIQSQVDWPLAMINFHPNQTYSDSGSGNALISGVYGFDVTGNTSYIYLIDSGVNGKLAEFGPEGRVQVVHSIYESGDFDGDTKVPPISENPDCDGHGTKVSSLIGGLEFGVAKGAKIRGIQAMDCDGQGTTAGIIEALSWTMQDIATQGFPPRKVVINLSLGGPRSAILDLVVGNLIAKGVTIVAAAGNEDASACTKSPAGHSGVLAVGAVTIQKERASFSNFGECVDIMAPGAQVRVMTKDGDTVRNSGTSLSAPLVTGVLALLIDLYPDATQEQLKEHLYELARKGILVQDTLKEAPNLLLQAPSYNPNGGTPLVVIPPRAPSNAFTSLAKFKSLILAQIIFLW